MPKIAKTKIRAFLGGVFAIVLVVLLAAVATAVLEKEVPILSDIARAIGL